MKELEIKLKIISIYRKLIFERNINIDKIIELYIEYLKLSVRLGTNNPTFHENSNKYRYTNCYCYALGLTYPKLFHDMYYDIEIEDFIHNLGFISQKPFPWWDIDKELDNLYSDLEVLNIKFYETNIYSENKHGGYKIALYKAPSDIHFLRQNADGTWSEKQGYTPRIVQMDEPRPIEKHYQLVKTLEIVKPVIK